MGFALRHFGVDKVNADSLGSPAAKVKLVWAFWSDKYDLGNAEIRDKTHDVLAEEYDLSEGDKGANAVLNGKKRGRTLVSKLKQSNTRGQKARN